MSVALGVCEELGARKSRRTILLARVPYILQSIEVLSLEFNLQFQNFNR